MKFLRKICFIHTYIIVNLVYIFPHVFCTCVFFSFFSCFSSSSFRVLKFDLHLISNRNNIEQIRIEIETYKPSPSKWASHAPQYKSIPHMIWYDILHPVTTTAYKGAVRQDLQDHKNGIACRIAWPGNVGRRG